MTKKEIVKILMNRDGVTREEAEDTVQQVQDDINYMLDSGDASMLEAEDVISDLLGLEPDYLMAFI